MFVAIGQSNRSEHHFRRYARSLGYMDWANQPYPFRYYEGGPRKQLDLNRTPRPLAYDRLYEHNPLSPKPVDLDSLAEFLRYRLDRVEAIGIESLGLADQPIQRSRHAKRAG